MEPVTDDEVLRVMIAGGEDLCDHALSKWTGNAYGTDEAMRREYIRRWGIIRRSIRPLAKRIKEATSGQPTTDRN